MWENLCNQTQEHYALPDTQEASLFLQKRMQEEAWPRGLESISKLPPRQRTELQAKSPFLDPVDGLIKVGGRLDRAELTFGRKPLPLMPNNLTGDAHLGYLQSKTEHQGRKITSTVIREAGFWPTGGRNRIHRLVST